MNAMDEPARNKDKSLHEREERGYVSPSVNISATSDEYLLEVDMPGVRKEGLEISIEGAELQITGRRAPLNTHGELYYCESGQCDYRRTFELATEIDTNRVSAVMEQGVLKLRLPVAERVKPKKIQVTD